MNQWRYWLTAATVAVILYGQTVILAPHLNRSSSSQAARSGSEASRAPVATPDAAGPPTASPPAQAAVARAEAAEPQPTAPAVPKGKLVVVDAGHGGQDPGTVHFGSSGIDLMESQVNLAVALRLAEVLRQDGYDVRLTRTDDQALAPDSEAADLQARVDLANQAGADLLVSVHHNGAEDPAAKGTTVLYCSDRPFGEESKRLATLTKEALLRDLRQAGYEAEDRGAQDDAVQGHLALLAPHNLGRPSNMPGIIGEALFVTNDQDAAQLRRPEIQEAIARGFSEGIDAYYAGP